MKNIQIGQRVLLRATEWDGPQRAEIIGIDNEVIMFCVDIRDRGLDDRDGLVEGSSDDILRIFES